MGQEPNKFHVSDDGKVYIINPDGTATEYGTVVKSVNQGNKSKRIVSPAIKWIFIVFILGVSFLTFGAYFDVENSMGWDSDSSLYALLCGVRYLMGICGCLIACVALLAFVVFRLVKQRISD